VLSFLHSLVADLFQHNTNFQTFGNNSPAFFCTTAESSRFADIKDSVLSDIHRHKYIARLGTDSNLIMISLQKMSCILLVLVTYPLLFLLLIVYLAGLFVGDSHIASCAGLAAKDVQLASMQNMTSHASTYARQLTIIPSELDTMINKLSASDSDVHFIFVHLSH
jgi:hypothetical protein